MTILIRNETNQWIRDENTDREYDAIATLVEIESEDKNDNIRESD